MACPNPADHGQLTSGDSEGANSCVAYSFSYGVCQATNGAAHASGEQIRDWTGDHSGGLELQQCDYAVKQHLGVDFDTKVITTAQFDWNTQHGIGQVMIGGYGPIAASKYSGQPYFKGNHGVWVPPGLKVMDPLCDGRRAGIYKYHGEAYPRLLIHQFAAHLILPGNHLAGSNHFEVSTIRMAAAAPAAAWEMHFDGGTIGYYTVSGLTVVGRTVMTKRNPYTARCTAPRRYAWPGHPSVRLVRITSGFAKGRYVNVGNTSIHAKEI